MPLRAMLLAIVLLALPGGTGAADLHVDCSKVIGKIRPLHGGNCGPLQEGGLIDLSAHFRDIAIPWTRLHDCHWPDPNIVDIHAVFPNFNADPSKPESYDFRRTDEYIKAVIDTGSKIVYRLGESIEHTKTKYRVHPPADYDKWPAVCVGIIRHYNEGWANGHRHGIRHWEIWNEPENRPAMWTGTDEDYFRLYETTARAIKTRFPDLKVGGPSLGSTGKIVDGQFRPTEFMSGFLKRCRDRSIPLDFFSWHLYTNDPAECVIRAKGIRQVLDDHGFKSAELHFNEWNYLPDRDWGPVMLAGQGKRREAFYERMGGAEGAAFAAAVLINLQGSPVDVANYFMSDNQPFGLFTQHGVPKKTFHAFKAFSMMMGTPVRVQVAGGDPGRLVVCAGLDADKSELRILVSNFKADEPAVTLHVSGLPWEGASVCEVRMLDAKRDLEKGPIKLENGRISLDLPAPGVCLVTLRKPQGDMNEPTLQQDPPRRRIGLLAALGPGILVAATGVGAGDIAGAGFAGSKLGYTILWAALLGAFVKFVVNEGLTRFQLATGQTLLEGMVQRFGVFFHAFFGVYLVLWSLGVGLSLISASGVALHSLLPVFPDAKTGRNVWGVAQSLVAVLVILFGSFKTFEKLMTALLIMMFASVVIAAAMFDHPWGQVVKGLLIPRIPREAGREGILWTLTMMGGVGGTLTVLCYGYWIRESGRTGPESLRLCRFDLAFAYVGTGLFGVAMAMLACNMTLSEGGGEKMMLLIADKLASILGRPFRYIFLLGAWAAVITSLLGVWQAVPYLFADFYTQIRRYYAKDRADVPEAINRAALPYRLYLLFLAFVPTLGLQFSFERIQQAQAMLGAIVMPMLAAALLVLNSNPKLVGERYRNRWATVLVLLGVVAFFAYAGYLTLRTGKSILS